MKPFTKDQFEGTVVRELNVGDMYRAVSPVVMEEKFWTDLRKNSKNVGFQIGTVSSTFYVGGPGHFLGGVGSYKELVQENVLSEVKKLLSGEKTESSILDANKMYALIVAVEGCARSMHNIAITQIFLENWSILHSIYRDKNLFQLVEMFLTFTQPGGSAKSKNYEVNTNELRMIIAHCNSNGIEISEEAIGRYLHSITDNIMRQAQLRGKESAYVLQTEYPEVNTAGVAAELYPLNCKETLTGMIKELQTTDFFGSMKDEEVLKVLMEVIPDKYRKEEHTLYDWEGIAGIIYIKYYCSL